ncbi:MAG: peptide chain release factor 2 [Proteobacteria bacterium]|nr:peptide chain release factor 2 [Pseudomonadota bacterium]
MVDEVRTALEPLQSRVSQLGGIFDVEGKQNRVDELESQSTMPGFWDDNVQAQTLLKEKGQLERVVKDWAALNELVEEVGTLIELAVEMDDEETAVEAKEQVQELATRVRTLETRRLLSEDEDRLDAIVEVNPGMGGTDACDFAELLTRMYSRWAEQHGFTVEVLDRSPGEEAGIKSATLAIRGEYAYGYMQAESGVHRLVRISPFGKPIRQTSFAAVAAYPEIDDDIEIDLNPSDIRMDTMRASGAGGQHINTTDSAVRLTHEPTGLVVLCRAERSQHKNRDKAMKMLRAKLYQLELDKRLEAQAEQNAKKMKIDFGSQIRSYVMQPYQQVKDLRTEHVSGDVSGMLDGAVLPFMEAWLAARADGALGE